MTYPLKTKFLFWAGAAALFIAFIMIFKSVLTPFVLGLAIAYLLNPLVVHLSNAGFLRSVAVSLILLVFFVLVALAFTFLLPPAAREAAALAEKMPGYFDQLLVWSEPYFAMVQEKLGADYIDNVKNALKENAGKIFSATGGLLTGLMNGGQALAGFITTIILTPLVAFFMMKEWPAIVDWTEDLYPREHEKVIRDLLSQIDRKISGFVRGQITVAFVLGVIYALALSIAGLNYGFLIGLSAGFLSIIPMVGSTLGLLVGVIVAWFQSGDLVFVGTIAAIFIVGQIVEGNILTPKLIGNSVGMHPLWILFALMAGGSLFGILGMLLAVPVAAVIGVLASFVILQYKASPFYQKKRKHNPKKKPKKKAAPKKATPKKKAKK